MLYPKEFLKNLGKVLLQIDFIGPRYLKGNGEPIHFISLKYVRPFKQHLFMRIENQKTSSVLNAFHALFLVLGYPVPDIVQMDNDSAFRGYIDRKDCVGRVIRWLCGNGVIPLFNAPNSPWNNGAVEGGNSVFDKKFWQAFRFESLEEVDQKLKEFNEAYKTYLMENPESIIETSASVTDPKKKIKISRFIQPDIYFLRVVREYGEKCKVEALNQYYTVPGKYKGQYVIMKLSLTERKIRIFQEVNKQKNLIYQGHISLNL